MIDKRLFFTATERNSIPIGDALLDYLPNIGTVLEVASGSGQHAVTFQKRFSQINWQASESNLNHLDSINAWITYERLDKKMPTAIQLDVNNRPWKLTESMISNICSIVAINLLHVSSWNSTESLLMESIDLLGNRSNLIIYGPFKVNGEYTSQTNLKI